ncbi:MAG TPA: Gfo/Idh/MocA family oxidoreductase [Candidatus Eisenbacteria bacterium]|nr:Gfo/Idh/MocA family oxidoreductase [Candidatus Eisenbacteria bacterium]
MKNTVKVAVIGAGKLGSKHAEVYSKLPGVELAGVYDTHEDRSREVAARCGTRAFKDMNELIGLVDAASIVVPSEHHFSVSRQFLERRIPLLIEKPITTDLADADTLLELARKNETLVQVGHIERFNSAIRAIKDVIRTPRFIECHRLGPYDPRVAETGVVLDLMIHDIDIVLDLVRSPIQNVDSVGACILSKTEDIANARIRFANRSVCDLTASRVTPDKVRKIRIFQDDAYISLDYITQEAQIYTKDGDRIHHKKIDITKSDSLKAELTDFIECVRTGKRPLVSGEEGRAALALALQISRQIREDGACAPAAPRPR